MCPGYSFYQQQIVTKRLWLVVSPPLPRFSPLGEPTMRSRTIAALVMILLAELSAGRRRNMASLPSKFEMNGSHKMNGSHTLVVQLQCKSTVDLRVDPFNLELGGPISDAISSSRPRLDPRFL